MFITNKIYTEDIDAIASYDIEWDRLRNKKILITGATGLIGTFLIDLLMYRNSKYNDKIVVFAVGRNKEKALERFKEYFASPFFTFIQKDIQIHFNINIHIDYVIHGASNTHPVAYATEPINTILLSVVGTQSILNYALKHNVKRTLFLSTVEIYGENRGDVELFKEDYCGYLNCNTLRAGYPESKRTAEALCQAFIKEKKLDILIARCCRVYGPTMGNNDSKAIAQFIRSAVNGENIILKSKGDQTYSYCHVADICSALLVLLLNGKNGEAYNISNNDRNLSLLEIAHILSKYTGNKIIFDIPSSVESAGFSTATKALLDSSKLKALGWDTNYPIEKGLIRTVNILRQIQSTTHRQG